MAKIAIIGSNGFIGKHINWYLRQLGETGISTYDCIDLNEPHYTKIDITSTESVARVDVNVDYIYFFSGLTGTYAGFDHTDSYLNINERGLLNLLNHIRQSGFRPKLIFPSTRLVYKGVDKPLKENDEKETKTIYAVNKLACEGYLYAYRQSFDIPYTIFRICIPYGNLLEGGYSFGTIGFFHKMASEGKDITLYGGGNIKRTFTHMADICEQMVRVSVMPESDGEIYNIGGETYSLREAAEMIASIYKTKVVMTSWPEKDFRIESNHTYFDDTKIKSLLGGYEYHTLREINKYLQHLIL